jgi:hypothetical protein
MKQYYVKAVEDSEVKIYKFKTKKEVDNFVKKFSEKVDPMNGYWIDFIFKGELIYKDDSYGK